MNQLSFKRNKLYTLSFLSPLLFFISEVLHPVSHESPVDELQSIMNNQHIWLTAHLFQLGAILFLPIFYNYLIRLNKREGASILNTKITKISKGLFYPGLTGISTLLFFDFILWKLGMNGPVPERVVFFQELISSPIITLPFLTIGPVIFLLSLISGIIPLFKNKTIPKIKTTLLLTGIMIYGLAGPLIPVSNGHILVAAGGFILLIGTLIPVGSFKKL